MAVSTPITKTKITTQWGTSVSTDIADLQETLTELQQTGGGITVETAIDAVAAALKPGNNIDITYDDELGTITVHVEPLTKTDVSLGNVDNTSDVTKPISTATQAALDTKADSVATTSALSTRQPLDVDLTTIAALTATTGNIIQSVDSAWASRTPTELKATLSLDNVNNTSDANKPVSTATQTALNTKLTTPVWTAYTPIIGPWSLGNGSALGRYMQIGKLVVFSVRIQFGSSSVFTAANPTISIPFPVSTTVAGSDNRTLVNVSYADWTGGQYTGRGQLNGSLCTPLITVVGSGYISDANVSSTVPMAWAISDSIWVSGTYEAA